LNNGFFGQHDVGGTLVEQKRGFQFCTEKGTQIQRMYVARFEIFVEGTNSFFPLNFSMLSLQILNADSLSSEEIDIESRCHSN